MSEIYSALGDTEYGQILQGNVRFERFKPDCITNEVWVDVLGDDVNNLRHMQHTANITAWYIFEAESLGVPFTEEEQDLLMTTAFVHDFAEAIDGDVADPDKVDSDEVRDRELRSFVEVASSVTQYPELLADRVLPVMQGTHPLSRHFRAIEHIGYDQTAWEADYQSHQMGRIQRKHELSFPALHDLYHALRTLHEVVHPASLRDLASFADLPVIEKYIRS